MEPRKPQVVIIGAGISGLGAAQKIFSDPGKRFDVTILEASSRVGGRLKTVPFSGGYKVEFGCTFLYLYDYEDYGKPLLEFMRKKGFIIGKGDQRLSKWKEKGSDELAEAKVPHLRLFSNGEQIPRDQVKRYQEIFLTLAEEAHERTRRQDWSYVISSDAKWKEHEPVNPKEISFADYSRKRFMSVTKDDPQHTDDSFQWKPRHILENLITWEGFMWGVKMTEGLDLASYGDDLSIFSDEEFIFKGTYQGIADALADEIPPECIHLNAEVQSIHWTPATDASQVEGDKAPITITCTNDKIYSADHVIVTVSLGVLKDRCCSACSLPLFHPKLPEQKLSAISKLGMGKANKVVLEFPSPIINGQFGSIELYWDEKDYGFPQQYPWATRQYILERVEDSNIFIAWFAGEDAIAIEGLTDSELAEGICLVLEKFLRQSIDRPVRIERSTWCGDKLFLGSYSYNHTGSSKLDREVLSQPVDGSTPLQLLFAGEATHQRLFSTLHGGYESGVREAERLLKVDANNISN